jgi:hypothetical protein
MNKIIYPTPEGGVAVIIPAESVEAALKDVPAGVDYEIVSEDAIPSDRFFRNAWVKGDCCVDLDLDKCKAVGSPSRSPARMQLRLKKPVKPSAISTPKFRTPSTQPKPPMTSRLPWR